MYQVACSIVHNSPSHQQSQQRRHSAMILHPNQQQYCEYFSRALSINIPTIQSRVN